MMNQLHRLNLNSVLLSSFTEYNRIACIFSIEIYRYKCTIMSYINSCICNKECCMN